MQWAKTAAAGGSGLPDPVKSEAAATPPSQTTPVVVGNKPAPGQTGPRGMAPRATYSRVNTGAPPTPGVGTEGKSTPPRGMEFLPKVAYREKISMANIMSRPTMQDLVKEAMAGTLTKVHISAEAARALGVPPVEQAKTAAAPPSMVPSDVIEKTAAALEFLASKEAASPGSAGVASPGVGPGQGAGQVMQVLEAESSGANIDAGQQGQATSKNVPPKDPPMQSTKEQKADPSNAMQTNDDMQHAEQPVDPMHNEKASIAAQKQAEALFRKNAGVMGLLKAGGRMPPTAALKRVKDMEADKEASALKRKNLGMLKKMAEDAINPAQISAGAASAQGATAPQGVSPSEEGPIPSEPSDVNSQKRHIASNQAAIDYTKRDAKKDPKKDLGHLLTEPALSASTDKTLERTLDHTGQAGAKIASSRLTKTAAAHALLLKMAEETAAEVVGKVPKGKKKASQMGGGGLSTPSGQSGFTASTMGGAGGM